MRIKINDDFDSKHHVICFHYDFNFQVMFVTYIIVTVHYKIKKKSFDEAMNFGSLYSRLRITAAATQSEIKGAYYRLCKIYHPDKNVDNPVAAQRFREITEAYEILGNEETRANYDKGKLNCLL